MGELYRLDFPNGKSYVGLTISNSKKRFASHSANKNYARKARLPLYQAWKKYGDPKLVVLAILENDDLAAAEIKAIKVFGTQHPNGYNMSFGGEISPMSNPEIAAKVAEILRTPAMRELRRVAMIGRTNSPETREKLRKANLGKKHTQETRNKLSVINKAKRATTETKEKRSESMRKLYSDPVFAARMREVRRIAQVGKPCSENAKHIASITHKGKIVSDETRAKLSEIAKVRMSDPARKKHLSDINIGRKMSPEHCAKMAEAQKLRRKNEPAGKKRTPEQRARMAEAQRRRFAREASEDGVAAQ